MNVKMKECDKIVRTYIGEKRRKDMNTWAGAIEDEKKINMRKEGERRGDNLRGRYQDKKSNKKRDKDINK